jgi:prepilin peptidase CpaA
VSSSQGKTTPSAPASPEIGAAGWLCLLAIGAGIASVTALGPGLGQTIVLSTSLAIIVALIAGCTDLATRTIPNSLTYPATVAGLALHVCWAAASFLRIDWLASWLGARSLGDGLLGAGAGFAVGLAGFAFRGIGGGDAKLLMALGSLLGFAIGAQVAFNAMLLAAVVAIVHFLTAGHLTARLQTQMYIAVSWVFGQRDLPKPSFSRTQIPFGMAMALGVLSGIAVPFLPIVNALIERAAGASS